MKTCNHCGHISKAKEAVCDACGRPFTKQKKIKPTTFENNMIDNQDNAAKRRHSKPNINVDFGDFKLKHDFSFPLLIFLLIIGFWPGIIYLALNIEKK